MTYDIFMEEIQKYYGIYPEGSKIPQYVLGYLQRDIDELKLDRLFRFVTYHHPHRFGAPGIAEIEKSISEALYKKKGEDVHAINDYTTMEEIEILTPEEMKEGEELLKAAGGLSGMMKDLTKAKRHDKQDSRFKE